MLRSVRRSHLEFFAIVFCSIFAKQVLSEITTFIKFSSLDRQNDTNTVAFYVHDWNTPNLEKSNEVRRVLLTSEIGVRDVIIADWTTFSRSPDYYNIARRYTSRVADDILLQIKDLVEIDEHEASDIECIGHGVGAHVCGQVGKRWNSDYAGEHGKIGTIIGLNPTGPYFREHPSESLEVGDATYVEAWHTDKRFGIFSDIADKDMYPKYQPETKACRNLRLLKKNQCLHNAVIGIFLNDLQGNLTNGTNPTETKAPMSILTLDVSPSMQEHGRIQNMVASSKRFVYSLPLGYMLGIVIFGGEAQLALPPTNITEDEATRQSLISNLPTTNSQISNTSIGAGILKAFDVIKSYLSSGEYCPDIILVTDGEENQAPFIRDVQPELSSVCSKVHTIALGDEADVGLEELSEITGGQTYFASDVDSLDKLTQSLIASSTSQFSLNKKPIMLTPKALSIDEPTTFIFDEGIGNDTTFLISTPNAEERKAELTAPNGQTFNNFSVDTDLHQLLFKLLEVQAGNWSIKLNSGEVTPIASRRRRQAESGSSNDLATVFVTTYPSSTEEGNAPIRLEAILKGRVLDYSRITPLAIEASLFKGEDAVVRANVEADIISSDGSRISIQLLDNGAGVDERKDDGIYTRAVTTELTAGKRYQVEVRATAMADGSSMLRSGEGDPFRVNDDELEPLLYKFERQTTAGSFRVSSESPYRKFPPNPIKDLAVVFADVTTRQCQLTWTAAGRESDGNGTVDSIRLSAFSTLSNNSEVFEFSEVNVIEGSLDPLPGGYTQNVTVEVPYKLWEEATQESNLDLYFRVESSTKEAGWSWISNIAPAEFGIPFSNNEETSNYLPIIIPILLIAIIIGIGAFVFFKRRSAFFALEPLK